MGGGFDDLGLIRIGRSTAKRLCPRYDRRCMIDTALKALRQHLFPEAGFAGAA
jgi:hypothetical protein